MTELKLFASKLDTLARRAQNGTELEPDERVKAALDEAAEHLWQAYHAVSRADARRRYLLAAERVGAAAEAELEARRD